MRKTITVLLCIISTISFGQVKLHNENEGMLNQLDDTTAFWIRNNVRPAYDWVGGNEQDTITVIMLVCDTGKYIGLNQNQTSFAYWIKGYEVRESLLYLNGCIGCEPIYLDENKKKLSQNIIVWQSK